MDAKPLLRPALSFVHAKNSELTRSVQTQKTLEIRGLEYEVTRTRLRCGQQERL